MTDNLTNPESENIENVLEGSENVSDNPENQDLENVSEIPEEPEYQEPGPQPNPWDDAPENVYFYEKMYPDGHLGSFTRSAELAYKSGWDLENCIAIEDTQQSDINGWTYPKTVCPHKTQEQLLQDAKDQKLRELKRISQDALDTAYVNSSLGFRADANPTAVRDLEGLVLIADSSVMFCDFNNEFHALTKEQVQTLQREVLLNGQNLYAQKWTFRTQIENAESIASLDDIHIAFEMLTFNTEE